MRWLVEITDITDKRFLSDLLAKGKDRLFPEENRLYLISDDFESLSTCSKVWERANEIRSIISEISSGLDANISFKLGTVYEQKEDGSRRGTVIVSGSTPIARSSVGDGDWTVTPEISEEEKLRLEVERLEREYQNKLALVSSRILPALRDECALKVYRLLQQEQTPVCMGHIIDLIKNDLGGKEELKKFVSYLSSIKGRDLVDRFYYSINNPKAFGYASRHILEQSKNEKSRKNRQPELMYSDEAKLLASSVADLWFNWKCNSDSNG